METPRGIRVAVEGCGHGTLHSIYASIHEACQIQGWDGVDLLIIAGDFQAVRNAADLNSMAVPAKFREIGDFHQYYSGERVAPYLTIFIGGNHEASNHLWELYYGGWAAPNIYYLGAANVVKLGPLRIASLSGIWKGYDYGRPHFERLPYSQNDVRSIYHVRELDVRRLLQLRSQVDVGISHDWPRGIEWLGNYKKLFSKKDQFEEEARAGTLGSVAAKLVLERLKPLHWFSAHLHIKYSALVDHRKGPLPLGGPRSDIPLPALVEPDSSNTENISTPIHNDEEIDLDLDEEEDNALGERIDMKHNQKVEEVNLNDRATSPFPDSVLPSNEVSSALRALLPSSFTSPPVEQMSASIESPDRIKNETTRFLALDKCLPYRQFLQLVELQPTHASSTERGTRPLRLSYDPEWLAITRVFADDLDVGDPSAQVSRDKGRAHYLPLIENEEKWVEENIVAKNRLQIPFNFATTAPMQEGPKITRDQPLEYNNPQTAAFCALLEVPNPFAATEEELRARQDAGPPPSSEWRGGERRGGHRGRGGYRAGRGGRGFGRSRGRSGGRGESRGGW